LLDRFEHPLPAAWLAGVESLEGADPARANQQIVSGGAEERAECGHAELRGNRKAADRRLHDREARVSRTAASAAVRSLRSTVSQAMISSVSGRALGAAR
jgi:hypothetical protein